MCQAAKTGNSLSQCCPVETAAVSRARLSTRSFAPRGPYLDRRKLVVILKTSLASTPELTNDDYLNAGFFILRPDRGFLDYYMSILRIPNHYDSQFPEQNLFNYAHGKDGNMPWQHVAHTWNIHYPTITDLEMGCKSLHEKWWAPVDDRLKPYMESWRWRMEGFFEARDLAS